MSQPWLRNRNHLYSLCNLRSDGRKSSEIRRMRFQLGVVDEVAGSALVEMGLTAVLATVVGPTECTRRSDELPDRAVLQVQFSAAPFCTADRRHVANNDRRFLEVARLVQRALEASMLLHLYPRSLIQIQITVLSEDGGRLCAAINAASCAVVHAGLAVKDLVCACAAGGVDPVMVDLNRREEMENINMACAMLPQRGTIVLSQCEARLPNVEALDVVLETAMEGCRAVFAVMQAAIRENSALQWSSKRGKAVVSLSETAVA